MKRRKEKKKAIKNKGKEGAGVDVGWRSRGKLMEEDQEECEQKEKRFRKKNKQSNKK